MTRVMCIYDPRHLIPRGSCDMMIFMKRVTLEPGLLQFLRLYVVITTLLMPLLWRL